MSSARAPRRPAEAGARKYGEVRRSVRSRRRRGRGRRLRGAGLWRLLRSGGRRGAVGRLLLLTSSRRRLLRIFLLQARDHGCGNRSQPEHAQRGPGHEPEHRHEIRDADQRHSDQQRARPLPPVLGAVLGDHTAANPAGSGHPADQTGEQQRADHERYHHQSDDRHGQYEEHRPDQQHHQHSAEAGAQRLLRQHVHAGPHRTIEQEIDCQVEQHE